MKTILWSRASVRADPWSQSLSEVYSSLETSRQGLDAKKAADRLTKHGVNQLEEAGRRHLLLDLAKRFSNPLVLILMFAAGIAALTPARRKAFFLP